MQGKDIVKKGEGNAIAAENFDERVEMAVNARLEEITESHAREIKELKQG